MNTLFGNRMKQRWTDITQVMFKKKTKPQTQTNLQYSKGRVFVKACKCADLPPTTRQASKYRMGKGLAVRYAKRALQLSNQEVIKETFNGN